MRSYLLIGVLAATSAFFHPAAANICDCDDADAACLDTCGQRLKACVFNCGITTADCYTHCVQQILPSQVTEVVSKVSHVVQAIPTVSAVLENPEAALSYAISEAIASATADARLPPLIHNAPLSTITPVVSIGHDSDDIKEDYDDGDYTDDDDDEEDCDDASEQDNAYEDDDDYEDDSDYDQGEDCDYDEEEEEEGTVDYDEDDYEETTQDQETQGPDSLLGAVTMPITEHLATLVPTPTAVNIKSAIASTVLPSISVYVQGQISSAIQSERARIDDIIQRQRDHFLNSMSSRLFAHPTPAIKADIAPLVNEGTITSRDIDPTMFAALDASSLANNPDIATALKAAGLPSDPATIQAMIDSGVLPTDPDALAALMESYGVSADPSSIAAAMGAEEEPTSIDDSSSGPTDNVDDAASLTNADEEECDGEDDEEEGVLPSGLPMAAPSNNVPQAGASVLPSDYPIAEQQVRATVTAHTTITSRVPSPSIGMLHGNGPSQAAHNSGAKTQVSSLLIASAAALFFNF